MNMSQVKDCIQRHRIIPVVVCDRSEDAPPLADALISGGLPIAEITLRTESALDAIRALAGRQDICVGAGTVLSREQAQQAIEAGARFVVSPGLDESVVDYCRGQDVLVTPGIATSTELQRASNLGISLVKFFPAEAMGGVKLLKALSGPFHHLRFVPTGGIHAGNLLSYLEIPQVLACGGSWMVPRSGIQSQEWGVITDLVRAAVGMVPAGTPRES